MKIALNDGWLLQQGDPVITAPDALSNHPNSWLPVSVPGDVHSALLKHGKIADPFYSTNIEQCRWVEQQIWWYRKDFRWEHPLVENEILELTFEGLDTYATIYLNGQELGTHQNMFTAAVFEISALVKQGNNRLLIRFDPVLAHTQVHDEHSMWYSYSPHRAWVRKAQMNFRWDWGPRLLTVGIWKNVTLTRYSTAAIANVFAKTLRIESGRADLQIDLAIRHFQPNPGLMVEIRLDDGQQPIITTLPADASELSADLSLPQARLWWPHDLGEPFLYDLEVHLKLHERILDTYHARIGIRTLTVKRRNQQGEHRFTFVINGVERFVKGANWIPAHNLIGSIPDAVYQEWITKAKDCRMNMLRVWGGGIYEKAVFYDECDRQGILVWQDFMFACSSYPDFDPNFMANVHEEITQIVISLRNHPCLAIWCGNNEIQWIHGQKMAHLPDIRLYGEKIYHDLMPTLLKVLDPTRLYWPSSPWGGNDPNSDEQGDKHNWQVWAGQIYPHRHGEPVQINNSPAGISFKHYAADQGKFISEFGMHASPIRRTLESCIPASQLYWGSFELRYRNKDKRPDRSLLLMESYTGLPSNLEQYIDYSMLAQAEGLKFGIEHYRRRKPDCSGCLIWQLNDCWPGMSWSIADVYGRPKAGFYYVRRAYHPILLSFKEEGPDTISLWGVNDRLIDYPVRITIGLKDFFGNPEYSETETVVIPANASVKLREFSKNRLNVTYTHFEFLYVSCEDPEVDGNIFFFEAYKDLNLPPCHLHATQTTTTQEQMNLSITTDCFAKFIKIDCNRDGLVISDNYFDLMPNGQKHLTVTFRPSSSGPIDLIISAINSAAPPLALTLNPIQNP